MLRQKLPFATNCVVTAVRTDDEQLCYSVSKQYIYQHWNRRDDATLNVIDRDLDSIEALPVEAS